MSLASWKKEFMPEDFHEGMSDREATEHSLKKWIGLRAKNLERHEITAGFRQIFGSDGRMLINGSSCALCFIHLESENSDGCGNCPLFQTLGAPCDVYMQPYYKYCETKNPEPMIRALRKTLKNLDKQQGEA